MTDVSIMFFPMNLFTLKISSCSPTSFADVEHFSQCEIFCIHNEILIVLEILTHASRCIHRHNQKHFPNYWMFRSCACNVGHSCTFCPHLFIFLFTNSAASLSATKFFRICHFLSWYYNVAPIDHEASLRTLQNAHSAERRGSSRWGSKLCNISREVFSGFSDRSCAVTYFSIWGEDQKTVLIQSWKNLLGQSITLPWSIVYNRFPRSLTSVPSLPGAWWSWRRHDRWRLRKKIHQRSWFWCESFFSWFLLNSLRHCSRPNCRTEMANAKWAQQMIPLITCDIPFG